MPPLLVNTLVNPLNSNTESVHILTLPTCHQKLSKAREDRIGSGPVQQVANCVISVELTLVWTWWSCYIANTLLLHWSGHGGLATSGSHMASSVSPPIHYILFRGSPKLLPGDSHTFARVSQPLKSDGSSHILF